MSRLHRSRVACVFRYDRKLDEEVRNYNPFGRVGGGAPVRDTDGNIVGEYNVRVSVWKFSTLRIQCSYSTQ